MLGDRKKIFMIGGYSRLFRDYLVERGIYIESVLDGGCPFALVGENDQRMLQYIEKCDDFTTTTYIKKNLANVLSRNRENYENNLIKIPFGKSVDYYNTTSFLVIYFTSITDIWKIGECIYALPSKSNAFSVEVKRGEKIPVPFPKFFNWMLYIKEFAEICKKNYDSQHIILIRANVTDYCFEDGVIKERKETLKKIREQVKMVEEYFIGLTNCCTVNDFYNCIPIGENESPFKMPSYACEKVAESIGKIILHHE